MVCEDGVDRGLGLFAELRNEVPVVVEFQKDLLVVLPDFAAGLSRSESRWMALD